MWLLEPGPGTCQTSLPQASNIVLNLDASSLPAGKLALWPDAGPFRTNGTQSVASAQPTVVPFSRYCASAVRYPGNTFVQVANAVQLNPYDQVQRALVPSLALQYLFMVCVPAGAGAVCLARGHHTRGTRCVFVDCVPVGNHFWLALNCCHGRRFPLRL